MKVKWTRKALISLDQIAEHIAQDDPKAASKMVQKVMKAVDRLTQHPSMGRPGRVPATRELVIIKSPYIVPYHVRGDTIEILRVFHAAREWPDSFSEE